MIYLYFSDSLIIASGGVVTTKCYNEGNNPREVNELVFKRYSFGYDHGRPYFVISGALVNYEIPEDLQDFLVEVSYHDNFGSNPCRQLGFYQYRTATAELMQVAGSNNSRYQARLLGKNVRDTQKLNLMIREGSIRPVVDYEQDQVPQPARHLRQLLNELWALIRCELSNRLYRIKQYLR